MTNSCEESGLDFNLKRKKYINSLVTKRKIVVWIQSGVDYSSFSVALTFSSSFFIVLPYFFFFHSLRNVESNPYRLAIIEILTIFESSYFLHPFPLDGDQPVSRSVAKVSSVRREVALEHTSTLIDLKYNGFPPSPSLFKGEINDGDR